MLLGNALRKTPDGSVVSSLSSGAETSCTHWQCFLVDPEHINNVSWSEMWVITTPLHNIYKEMNISTQQLIIQCEPTFIGHYLYVHCGLIIGILHMEGRKEMFYLTTHSTHFIYGYMVSDIWLRTILIVRKETLCRHIGYSFRLTARVLLYASSHRQDSTYHGLCYTSRGALAGTTNSSMGPPHEGSIRRPIAP